MYLHSPPEFLSFKLSVLSMLVLKIVSLSVLYIFIVLILLKKERKDGKEKRKEGSRKRRKGKAEKRERRITATKGGRRKQKGRLQLNSKHFIRISSWIKLAAYATTKEAQLFEQSA